MGLKGCSADIGKPQIPNPPLPLHRQKASETVTLQQNQALCSAGSSSVRAGRGICSSAAHPGLRRERGSLVFTEAEGLLGRALSKQLRASPARSSLEQREPSHTGRGDKEPPKRFPQGHLWQGRSWGDTQTDPRGLVVGSGPPRRGQAGGHGGDRAALGEMQGGRE